MSLLAISAAVEARLAAHWDQCPVRGLNDPDAETPDDGQPYLQVEYPATRTAQITFGAPGANTFRIEGGFVLVLKVQRGSGTKRWLVWMAELATVFRAVSFDGVRCFEPAEPFPDGSNRVGGWFELSVAVPYEFDFLA